MSIISLVELAINSINEYKTLVSNHNREKEYGSDIVSSYNVLGENIEALSQEVEEIFSKDKSYIEHFESDEIQDFISEELNRAFNEYQKVKSDKNSEEKILLAYEWLFEVLLFTCDDEEIKSKITLDKNDITIMPPLSDNSNVIKENSKIVIKIKSGNMSDEVSLNVEEIVDDYLYCYLGDNENEEDLIIFHKSNVSKVVR